MKSNFFWEVKTDKGVYNEKKNKFSEIKGKIERIAWKPNNNNFPIIALEFENFEIKPLIFRRNFLILKGNDLEKKIFYCLGFKKDTKRYLILIDEDFNVKTKIEDDK